MSVSLNITGSIIAFFVTMWMSYYFGGIFAEGSDAKHRIGARVYLLSGGGVALAILTGIGLALERLYQVPICLVQPIWLACLAGGLWGTFQLYVPLRKHNFGPLCPSEHVGGPACSDCAELRD